MGAPTAQVQSPLQPSGKGAPAPAVMPNNSIEQPIAQPGDDFIPGQRPAGGYARIQDINPRGKGGAITTPIQSGQPSIGRPNTYANTVGPWDNSTNSTQMPFKGKGKGA